jgi:hypothetical protein
MRHENAPVSFSWLETPPSAPYDPPQPAPQAKAWRLALKVVGCVPARRHVAGKAALRSVKSARPAKWS